MFDYPRVNDIRRLPQIRIEDEAILTTPVMPQKVPQIGPVYNDSLSRKELHFTTWVVMSYLWPCTNVETTLSVGFDEF